MFIFRIVFDGLAETGGKRDARLPSEGHHLDAVDAVLKVVVEPIRDKLEIVPGIHVAPLELRNEHVGDLQHAVFIGGANVVNLIDTTLLNDGHDARSIRAICDWKVIRNALP